MNPVRVVAASAISALGRGRAAFHVGDAGAPAPQAIGADSVLADAALRRPLAARVPASLLETPSPLDPDRAARMLRRVAGDLGEALDRQLGDWRTRRIAYVIGTSGGAMDALCAAFAARERGAPLTRDGARDVPYFAPLSALDELPAAAPESRVQVLAACASATIAIGIGCRWLELGHADLVIAGGYDALSTFIAAGFESLGATSEARPRPFRVDRDGMSLGEGAALLALMRSDGERVPALGQILGFGASCDAVHVTAPDRTGHGLYRAASAALHDADVEPDAVDFVSAHATATPFNDAAEARALAAVFGSNAARVPIHPFKASIGHTLGASGALETLAAFDAIAGGVHPAAAGAGPIDPDFRGVLLQTNLGAPSAFALKLSAAFGGANASLVLAGAERERARGPVRAPRAVHVAAVGAPCERLDVSVLGERAAALETKLSRLDPLSEYAVAAVADVAARCSWVADGSVVGVVVGTATATIEANERFDARLRARGARAAEPRRFPATSPNLCAGDCAIVFGLTGPVLSAGAGLAASIEALLIAHDLIACGDADEVFVVAAEEVGPVVRWLWATAGWPTPASGAAAVLLSARRGVALRRDVVVAAMGRAAATGALAGSEPGAPALLAAVA